MGSHKMNTYILFVAFNVIFLVSSLLGDNQENYPEITKVNSELFEFGQILINKERREFSFPAICNQTNGLVEYALVHDEGKTHESLMRTSVSPRLIHACLLLLKEKPQAHFFSQLKNSPSRPGQIHSIKIFVEWKEGGVPRKETINSMVVCQTDGRVLKENTFVFTGSKVMEGSYLAEMDGSIVAIYHDERATLNSRDDQSKFDDVWIANELSMPAKETPVTIRFQLPSNK